jgi:hypothetical protein
LMYPPNRGNPDTFGAGGIGDTLYVFGNYSSSDYHALQTKFQRQFTHGLGAIFSYTWSHSLDDFSMNSNLGTVSVPTASSLASGGIPFVLYHASSDFDIRHIFAFSMVYNIPSPKDGLARAIFGHWNVDPIFHYQTAAPIDVVANTTSNLGGASNLTQRPNQIPGVPVYVSTGPGNHALNTAPVTAAAAALAGCIAPTPSNAKGAFCTPLPVGTQAVSGTLGRNAIRAFPLSELDFSLHREFPLRESIRLRFQAEMFNVFNHPNFGPMGNNMTTGTFGVSTSMANSALGSAVSSGVGFSPIFNTGGPRNFQFALKLFF